MLLQLAAHVFKCVKQKEREDVYWQVYELVQACQAKMTSLFDGLLNKGTAQSDIKQILSFFAANKPPLQLCAEDGLVHNSLSKMLATSTPKLK